MLGWAENWKVGLVHIQPGRPMQNGHVESFHGRVRDECLNANWFPHAQPKSAQPRLRRLREIISKQNQNWETPVRYALYATWSVDDAAVPGQSPIVAHRAMTRAMSKTFSLCRDFDGDPDAFKQTKTPLQNNTPEFSYIADVHLYEFWQCKCIQAIEELNQPSMP
jgi:hypothetical protein